MNIGNLNMLKVKERNPHACLAKGSYAVCHTRWRGLESHLFFKCCCLSFVLGKQLSAFSQFLNEENSD